LLKISTVQLTSADDAKASNLQSAMSMDDPPRYPPRIEHDEFVVDDLNELKLVTDTDEMQPLADFGTRSTDGSVEVVFRNIERRLIAEIEQAQVVVGCVAWLTSGPILDALAQTLAVSIVVQKEDFLRRDLGSPQGDDWRRWLRGKYERLPWGPHRYEYLGTVVSDMSTEQNPDMHPVRCLGNHNADRRQAMPRAHHKFLVFCDYERGPAMHEWRHSGRVVPRKVWTGSYNLSKNAGRSLENAVLLSDPQCVRAYWQEWGQLVGVSEPLDWTSIHVHPDLRIGT
jgi:hypothetical protein